MSQTKWWDSYKNDQPSNLIQYAEPWRMGNATNCNKFYGETGEMLTIKCCLPLISIPGNGRAIKGASGDGSGSLFIQGFSLGDLLMDNVSMGNWCLFLVNHWFVFGHQYTQFSDKSEVIIPAKSTEGFHLFFSINKNYRYFEDQGASWYLYRIPIERFPKIPKIGRYPQIIYFDMMYFDMMFHYKPSS